MQGEEAEQQMLMDLRQVSDIGMEREQQKRGQHATGLSSSVSRRSDAMPAGKPSVSHGILESSPL
jgi:hypothetical protein